MIDISGRNIAFSSSRLSKMIEECLFEVIGRPKASELAQLDGKPLNKSLLSQLVKAIDWVDWIEEDEEDLRIIDLGEAFLEEGDKKMLGQPGSLRALETILTNEFDSRLDLWYIGIVIRKLCSKILQRLLINILDRFIL